jgi:hypothetical protein
VHEARRSASRSRSSRDRPVCEGARLARVAADPRGRRIDRSALNVCNDFALRSWILGFGPLARVVCRRTSPRRSSPSWRARRPLRAK